MKRLIVAATMAGALACAAAESVGSEAAYIESDGTSGISTGYRMKTNSRIEVDFALTTAEGNVRIFGAGSGYEPNLPLSLYVDGSVAAPKDFVFQLGFNSTHTARWGVHTGIDADTVRHTAILDLPNMKLTLKTGDAEWSGTAAGLFSENAQNPVALFAQPKTAAGTTFDNLAKARIYSVKIYESGELVHDFEPYVKDGLAGFRDRVTGDFVTNGGAFTAFSAGGDYETYESPYVATPSGNSSVFIQTGYVATSNTCVELDCAFVDNPPAKGREWYLFAGGGGNNEYRGFISSGYGFYANVNGANQKLADSFIVNNWQAMAGIRRTYGVDEFNRKIYVITAGVTNGVNSSLPVSTQNGAKNGVIIGANTNATTKFAPLKIYGCKIYEEGVLVRDFAPFAEDSTIGLRDALTGEIAVFPKNTPANTLSVGGEIDVSEAPYIESLRKDARYVSIPYSPGQTTRMELDYSLAAAPSAASEQWFLFSANGDVYYWSYLATAGFHCNNNGNKNAGTGNLFSKIATIQGVKRTAVLDNPNSLFLVRTGSVTNGTQAAVAKAPGNMPRITLAINSYPDYKPEDSYSTIRIYAFRLYESDVLTADYRPAIENGAVGLRNVRDGGVFVAGQGTTPFTYGGVWPVSVANGGASRLGATETTTLTASAYGATRYRWLKNGEAIAGGEEGTLTVGWTKPSDGEGVRRDVYQAIAVFSVDGVIAEGEASAEIAIESIPIGMRFFVR